MPLDLTEIKNIRFDLNFLTIIIGGGGNFLCAFRMQEGEDTIKCAFSMFLKMGYTVTLSLPVNVLLQL